MTTTASAKVVVTDLAFEVYGSAAAAVTGKVNGEQYDLVSIHPSLLPDEDKGGPFSGAEHHDPGQMGSAVIQPIYDVIAAAFEGCAPGDYEHGATLDDLRSAHANLGRAIAAAGGRRRFRFGR